MSTEVKKPVTPSFMDFEFTNLVEMQQKACKHYAPNRLFGTRVGDNFEWMNYGDFGKLVDNTRKVLHKLGIGYNSRVAIISNNRVEWAALQFAAMGLGGQLVPMYEAQPQSDWEYIINDCGASVVVCANQSIYDKVKDYPGKLGQVKHLLSLDTAADDSINYQKLVQAADQQPDAPIYPVAQEDLATIIYTSGTTGKPKGVELMHQNIVTVIVGARALNKERLNKAYTSLAFLPWAHVYGLSTELNALISAGSAMGIVPSRDQIVESIGMIRPDVIVAVPAMFNKVYDGIFKNVRSLPLLKQKLFYFALKNSRKRNQALEFGKPAPFVADLLHGIFDKLVFKPIREKLGGNLKYMGSGGAAASIEVLQFFEDIGIPVCEGYGLTETAPIMSANSIGWENKRLGTVGPPFPGMDVRCVDPETLETVPPGEVGEVVISGPNVMRGYHNKKEATDEVIFFKDGKRFFKTGDMGRFVDNKFLQITGRIKEQFKLENGKYVVPAPLEDIYARGPLIAQSFLYGANQPYTVLLVVPNYVELAAWAKSHKKDALLALIPDAAKVSSLAEKDFEALFSHEDFVYAVTKELLRNGKGVKAYEQPHVWQPLGQPFSQENQMQTPKMSLRRPIILKAYQDKIDAMYKSTGGHRIEYPKNK